MKNYLVRKTVAAATALTITSGLFAMSPTQAAAAPAVGTVQIQLPAIQDIQPVHHVKRKKNNGYILAPQRIKRIVWRHGYYDIRRVALRKGKYHVRARGHRGPVKLVLNARNGQILSRERIRAKRHHHPHRGYYYGRSHNGFSWTLYFGN